MPLEFRGGGGFGGFQFLVNCKCYLLDKPKLELVEGNQRLMTPRKLWQNSGELFWFGTSRNRVPEASTSFQEQTATATATVPTTTLDLFF